MDQEQLISLVEKLVWEKFSENYENITQDLAKDLDWEDGWEKTVAQAVLNAVAVSTRLSVQIVIDLLIQTGAFRLVEKETPPQLTIIRGGADPEEPRK